MEGDGVVSEFLNKKIYASVRLHSTRQIILIHHMDCGGYGGHDAFENVTTEHDKQVADLKAARELILQRFPEINVRLVLARIGEGSDVDNIDFELVN